MEGKMAGFLKIVAGICLAVTWVVCGIIAAGALLSSHPSAQDGTFWIYLMVTCVGLSLPAAILFAFAAIVDDVSEMKAHLAAMRRYYEPERQA
jgi:hypothetical protein